MSYAKDAVRPGEEKDAADAGKAQVPASDRADSFDNASIGAIAHLYRGEVYRSTVWRKRLDATTNWSIVSLGLALSICFSGPSASPLPLVLVGVLIVIFLILEARRYRYFNVWRARARYMEANFYAPLLMSGRQPQGAEWRETLALDYLKPNYHIGFWRSVGRRLRRNYGWILTFQTIAYFAKILIHPTPLTSFDEMLARMAIGPIHGGAVLAALMAFHSAWIGHMYVCYRLDKARHGGSWSASAMG